MLQSYSQGKDSATLAATESISGIQTDFNQLSNTWTDTVGNVVNTEAISGVVQALNGLLNILNQVTDTLGSLGSIGLGAGLFASMKNVG